MIIQKTVKTTDYFLSEEGSERSARISFVDDKFDHCDYKTKFMKYDLADWEFLQKVADKIIGLSYPAREVNCCIHGVGLQHPIYECRVCRKEQEEKKKRRRGGRNDTRS